MDYQATLYDPVYTVLGVPCVLTLADTRSFDTLTALDKTEGVDVGDNVQVPTIKPVAAFRMVELRAAGIEAEDVQDATLTMNGFTWTVDNYKFAPSPGGENDGELYLILAGKEAASSS